MGCIGTHVMQGIVPESAAAQVKELFVPESRIETAKREAGQLAALDINQVSLYHSSATV